MECVAARFGRERMPQQSAANRVAWIYELRNRLEVALGFLFRPIGVSGRKLGEFKRVIRFFVADVTAGMRGPLFQENGLDTSFEKFVIERCGIIAGRRRSRGLQRRWGRLCTRARTDRVERKNQITDDQDSGPSAHERLQDAKTTSF